MASDSYDVLILGGGNAGFGVTVELINIFGLAKKHGITATALRDFVYAYPSFSLRHQAHALADALMACASERAPATR